MGQRQATQTVGSEAVRAGVRTILEVEQGVEVKSQRPKRCITFVGYVTIAAEVLVLPGVVNFALQGKFFCECIVATLHL